jgi:kynurenine formamidase
MIRPRPGPRPTRCARGGSGQGIEQSKQERQAVKTLAVKTLAGAAALAAAFAVITAAANAEALRQSVTATQVVDLSHDMYEGMSYWPGGVPFTMTRLVDYDQGYRLHKFEVGENTGTHIDAPKHFVDGAPGLDAIALRDLVVPAVVIDVKDKVADNVDYRLSAADVEAWEAEHGAIPAGSLVILNTGWHQRFADQAEYANQDEGGVMHFPDYAKDAAELLVARDVVGIGIDTLSLDYGPAKSFDTHLVMLGAEKYQIENLANLDALPPTGATVIVGVLKVRDGTQAQARILALLP